MSRDSCQLCRETRHCTCHPGQRLFASDWVTRGAPIARRSSAAESQAVATASRSSGNRCPYRSSVSTAVFWPRSFWTTFTFARPLIANDAHVLCGVGLPYPAVTCPGRTRTEHRSAPPDERRVGRPLEYTAAVGRVIDGQ
jgi:hypothetical protein